jgi:hypothetical protein
MDIRLPLAALVFIVIAGACTTASQQTDEKTTSEATSQSESQSSTDSVPSFMDETAVKKGDAPAQHHSCKRFSPREQALYLPEETYEAAQSGSGPEAFTRDQYIHFLHGLVHARKWHSRVEEGKKNSDHEGMSHEEIVIGIQRYRMEEAGSAEAFIQKRLGEELEAKQFAYEVINKMERFEPAPVSASRLTDEEKEFHRTMTQKLIDSVREEYGNPF